MQPMQKLMLLLFNLRAKLDKLAFPIFRFGQFSDFRSSKPQFQPQNMLVNNDTMPFFKFIGFIVDRECAAFRLILDRSRMLIGTLEFFIGICVLYELNRVVMGDRKGFLENIQTILNIRLAFIIQIAGQITPRQLEFLEPPVNADLIKDISQTVLYLLNRLFVSLKQCGWLICTGEQGGRVNNQYQPARTRKGLT